MTKVVYQIVEHGRRIGLSVPMASYSETFTSHNLARAAADRAAHEQRRAADDAVISFEDESGRWHDQTVDGSDQPETEVEG